MAVDQLRASIDDLPEKDESPSAAFRRKLAEQQVAVVIKGINEVDQITLGLSLDPVAQSASVDVSMTAVAGSELSRRMVTLQKTETQFGGFLVPSAAASFNVSSELSQQAVTDTKAQLEIAHERLDKMIEADGKLAAPADKTAAKEIVTELLSAVTATLAAGKIDGAASVVGHDSQWTLVSALHSADPKKVEDALKKFVELERRSRPNFPAPEWDVETVGDVRFHKLSVPLTAAKRSAALLGDHLDLVIGVGPGAVYCAAGADALSTLKKSLSGSGTSQQAPPMQLTLALAALAKAVDSTGQGAVVSIMAMGLQSAQGKDHLSLTVRPIASGVLYRVEVQEGLLGVGASMGLGLFGIPAGL
jgi:hypothetical protein